MAIKLLINGLSGRGKTDLLQSLGKESFVVSRDSKGFPFPIPHMVVTQYYNMETFIYGGKDNENNPIEGIVQKLDKHKAKYGQYPENIVFDTVSQLTMDVIDIASKTPDSWGSQGKEITRELAMFTKFVHEELELAGFNIIFLTHIIAEKKDGVETGNYLPFGQGQFKDKGGFYATVNEAITIEYLNKNRVVYTNDPKKMARTFLNLPDIMYVKNTKYPEKSKKLKEGEAYFNLKTHIDQLVAAQVDVSEWSL